MRRKAQFVRTVTDRKSSNRMLRSSNSTNMPIKQEYYFLLNRAVIKLCGSLQIVRLSIFSVFLSFETCCIVFSFLFFLKSFALFCPLTSKIK